MARKIAKPSARVREKNFADIHPPLTADQAVVESTRCLYCFDAPCMRSCPTHIDIPGFIRMIMHGNPIGAAKTILDENIFGGSCARVCPTEVLCEGACVDSTMLKEPVKIGQLQRFACDTADEISHDFYSPGPDSGKTVAVIGAGPAGLTCAHELRKCGHAVVIFEARNVAGGLNTLGIAAYKLSTDFALSEVERISRLGVDLRLKSKINGRKLARLLDEYDAVFLSVGLGKTAALSLPGESLDNVWESLDFVFQTHKKSLGRCEVGRHVLVIGGGNTAIDAAVAARKLGAESVTIAYRRDLDSMPAFRHEYELAAGEGIQFEWNAMPVRISGRGKASGARFVRTRLKGKGRTGKLTRVPNSHFTIKADMIIKALGQEPLVDLITTVPGLEIDEKHRVKIDPENHATSVPRLFAGGDCQSGAREEVVYAVQSGKHAAAGIHRFLSERG
jgi:glutamate synthase (NADPH/NADH) small chain